MENFNALISSLKGIVSSGADLAQVTGLIKDYVGGIDPGDFVSNKDNKPIVAAAPIAEDLWYLWNHVNGMTWVEENTDTELYMSERLSFFTSKLNGITAMRGVTEPGNIEWGDIPEKGPFGDFTGWKNTAKAWFQLIAFEILFTNQSFKYNHESSMPPNVDGKTVVVGYLTFPVGQYGVMEVISLVRESLSDSPTFKMQDDEKPKIPSPSQLFPPMLGWQLNKCYGRHLIESGYAVPENEKAKVVPIAKTHIPESSYGRAVTKKGWLRVWITKDEKWPIPGEFIGILCKPTPVPHAWWFQKSSPILYAGNWLDTFCLTSGVITKVETVDEDGDPIKHPVTDTTCTRYTLRVHGREVYIYSTDFLAYTVDQRVGIYKLDTNSDDPAIVYNHLEQGEQGDIEGGDLGYTTDFVIIPVEFYQ